MRTVGESPREATTVLLMPSGTPATTHHSSTHARFTHTPLPVGGGGGHKLRTADHAAAEDAQITHRITYRTHTSCNAIRLLRLWLTTSTWIDTTATRSARERGWSNGPRGNGVGERGQLGYGARSPNIARMALDYY